MDSKQDEVKKVAAKKVRPIQCVVTSDKMSKSRVAVVERLVAHARYGKYRHRRSKLMFHDENNESRMGDTVLVCASRPMSARKRFALMKVVERRRE